MRNNKIQQRNIKHHLVFMWVYLLGIYVPFVIYLIINHNVSTTPMSVIGWSSGGLRYLVSYLILTLPFALYLLFFFNRNFIGNNKFVKNFSMVCCILLTAGSFIPIKDHVSEAVLLAHTVICVSSSIFLMLTILYALILYAMKKKSRILLFSLYGIYVAALLIGFYILYTAALFQLMATVSFFLILLFVNTTSILPSAKIKKRIASIKLR